MEIILLKAFKKGASIALVDDQKFIGSEDSKIVYVKIQLEL